MIQDRDGAICLGCDGKLPPAFLDLGRMPLANAYLRPEQLEVVEEAFPLAVAYCPDCYLVQLQNRVPPEKLFGKYLYFSSFSDSFLAHARAMADSLVKKFDLTSSSRVLEVASNDGYLLRFFMEHGIFVLGVEPARNIAAEAERRGIPTLNQFFAPTAVEQIKSRFGRADMIIGNNVLAHVPGINEFLSAVRSCLLPAGVAVFEFPYIKELLERTEFDTIYHEHVFYYSVSSIQQLAARAKLQLFDVEYQPVHGGSLRIFLQHPGKRPIEPVVATMLEDEERAGLTSPDRFVSFGVNVETLKNHLLTLLEGLKREGKRVAAYGAPAKGNTLLNYCGIDTRLIEFTVDRSPYKQGMFLPGSHLPVLDPSKLLERRPDYTVILPWNIADEIISQQQEYQRAGGRFIVPIPQPRILNTNVSRESQAPA